MAVKIRKSNPNKPYRVMLYGVEGAGKSTFGALAENPVFIGAEGGTDNIRDAEGNPIEVNEIAGIKTWDDVMSATQELIKDQQGFKTLVIDSADWLERLAHSKIMGSSGKNIVHAAGGYGAGYRESETLHRHLINSLSDLRELGMNVIVTAHAHVKQVKDPDAMADYDGYEIKTHELVSSLWREWVDALFFVRFRAFAKTTDDTDKARAVGDDSRVVYAVKRPSFQAKNRYGMPAEMDFDLDFMKTFLSFAKKGVKEESLEEIKTEVDALAKLIVDKETKKKVSDAIKAADTAEKMKPIRARLRALTGKKEG